MHTVLLGDSVFDNAPYTAGGPAVIDHLRGLIGPGEEATLLAVDGHRVQDVRSQSKRAPSGGTHFFLSIGGNDALDRIELLNRRVGTAGEGLTLFGGPLTMLSPDPGEGPPSRGPPIQLRIVPNSA